MRTRYLLGFAAAVGMAASCSPAVAEDKPEWHAPFGGTFNANFTVATDYSFAGISNTQLGPAAQVGFDYKGPALTDAFPAWIYLTAFGSNVSFPSTGPGAEIDIGGGFKVKAFDRKLSFDLGYARYNYPDAPSSLGFNYGEIVSNLGYDFDVFELTGRLRFSPNSFGNSGHSWNKRLLVTVPLTFIKIGDAKFKASGSVGNIWVDNFLQYGIPSQDYWYWQIGLVTSAFGLDLTIAYTDTSIEPSGCGNTAYCSGRVFASLTKAF